MTPNSDPREFNLLDLNTQCIRILEQECMARARLILGPDASNESIVRKAAEYHAFIQAWPSPSREYH